MENCGNGIFTGLLPSASLEEKGEIGAGALEPLQEHPEALRRARPKRLSQHQRIKIYNWMKENKEKLSKMSAAGLARHFTETFGFPVSESTVSTMRAEEFGSSVNQRVNLLSLNKRVEALEMFLASNCTPYRSNHVPLSGAQSSLKFEV